MRIVLDTAAADMIIDDAGTTLRTAITKRADEVIELDLTALAEGGVDAIIGLNCFRINEVTAKKVDAFMKGAAQAAKRRTKSD